MIIGRAEELVQPPSLTNNEVGYFASNYTEEGVEVSEAWSDLEFEQEAWFRLPSGEGLYVRCDDLSGGNKLPCCVNLFSPFKMNTDGRAYTTTTFFDIYEDGIERQISNIGERSEITLVPVFLYDDYLKALSEEEREIRAASMRADALLGQIEMEALPRPDEEEIEKLRERFGIEAEIMWFMGKVCGDLAERYSRGEIPNRAAIKAEQEARGELTPTIEELQNILGCLERIKPQWRIDPSSRDWEPYEAEAEGISG